MFLENDTVILRALEPEDLDCLYRWENDTNVWIVSNTIEPYSRYILKEYIAYSDKSIYEKKQLRLMIVLKQSGQVVGAVDLFDFDPHNLRAGVGILIDGEYRRKGYAAMALDLLVEYSFDFLHINQLYAHIPSDKGESRELFCRHGFSQSGVLKSWLRDTVGFIDVEVYQLLKP